VTLAAPHAIVVLSGNELLDGRTRDVNGALVSRDLSARGAQVAEVVTVADDPQLLGAALRHALAAAPELLVVGGGLGTTHDDLTARCLADVLGAPLREHPGALAMVREAAARVAQRRHLDADEVFDLARRQALLPSGAEPLAPAGVAPGILVRTGSTRIVALPGVPFEFAAMWDVVAWRLEEEGFFPPVTRRVVRTWGIGEPQVARLIGDLPHDLLELGITVGEGEVTVHLRHRREEDVVAQADAIVEALVESPYVFSRDGRSVDEIVADRLRARGATLAVAESCTGGLVAARLTALPGSSDYFVGGVVSYANQAKIELLDVPPGMLAQYGAVSEPVAAAMAEGVRSSLGADCALAVTGVAGPSGGSADKPVGRVFTACACGDHTEVRAATYPGDRDAVRRAAVTGALHLLREVIAT